VVKRYRDQKFTSKFVQRNQKKKIKKNGAGNLNSECSQWPNGGIWKGRINSANIVKKLTPFRKFEFCTQRAKGRSKTPITPKKERSNRKRGVGRKVTKKNVPAQRGGERAVARGTSEEKKLALGGSISKKG